MIARFNACVVAGAVLSASSVTHASVVEFDIESNPASSQVLAPASHDPNVTVSAITDEGVGVANAAGRMGGNFWGTANTINLNTDYFGFTITPEPGFSMTLTEFLFAEKANNSSTPTTIELRSSVDSFLSPLVTISVPAGFEGSFEDHSVTLGSAFENLTEAVTFRLYGYGAATTSGQWHFTDHSVAGNLVVEGTVIPEPASLALLAGGGLLLARRRSA